MLEQVAVHDLTQLLGKTVIVLLILNMAYIFYGFTKKKIYYDKLLLTFAIYFSALIIEPVSASVKFNVKYGFGILDFLYMAIIIYIVIMAIQSNNIYFMYNISWSDFYKIVKEVFRREGINTYFRDPTIYIKDGEALISLSATLFSKRLIIVKIKGLQHIMNQNDFAEKILEQKPNFTLSRYYYLIINIVITIILLINAIY